MAPINFRACEHKISDVHPIVLLDIGIESVYFSRLEPGTSAPPPQNKKNQNLHFMNAFVGLGALIHHRNNQTPLQ
jgi:hypothetical protein